MVTQLLPGPSRATAGHGKALSRGPSLDGPDFFHQFIGCGLFSMLYMYQYQRCQKLTTKLLNNILTNFFSDMCTLTKRK